MHDFQESVRSTHALDAPRRHHVFLSRHVRWCSDLSPSRQCKVRILSGAKRRSTSLTRFLLTSKIYPDARPASHSTYVFLIIKQRHACMDGYGNQLDRSSAASSKHSAVAWAWRLASEGHADFLLSLGTKGLRFGARHVISTDRQ